MCRPLVDDDLALHAGTLVGLAVVVVLASHIKLGGHRLAGGVEVVLMVQARHVHARLQGWGGGDKMGEGSGAAA